MSNCQDALSQIQEMMNDCGRAMYDDREWTAPVLLDGEVVGGNGCNSFEADMALSPIAALLGLTSPAMEYDRLCEEAA